MNYNKQDSAWRLFWQRLSIPVIAVGGIIYTAAGLLIAPGWLILHRVYLRSSNRGVSWPTSLISPKLFKR